MKVNISQQVADFVRNQSPEPRKWLRDALKKLSQEKGDIKALEGALSDYYRLRVHGYRIIFAYKIVHHKREIFCIFAERRGIVYEIFESLLENFSRGGQS